MEILHAVLPVFLVIAIGAGARRFRFIGQEFIDTANALVYYLLLPALLFYKIGTSNFREAFNAPLVAGGYIATVATFLLATLLSRRLGIPPAAQDDPQPRRREERRRPRKQRLRGTILRARITQTDESCQRAAHLFPDDCRRGSRA